jgi:hypothetical protein
VGKNLPLQAVLFTFQFEKSPLSIPLSAGKKLAGSGSLNTWFVMAMWCVLAIHPILNGTYEWSCATVHAL